MLAPYSGITINSARRLLTRNFEDAGFESAQIDARILVGHAMDMEPSDLIANGTTFLLPEQFESVSEFARRRISGEPISQIIGYRDFWKDRFIVTQDVLTPRPETEGIIDAALARFDKQAALRILDLGTGSGAIILSLLREFPNAKGVAADVSKAALEVARQNAQGLGLDCGFIQSSWFDQVEGQFDLIVSNPPYITDLEMAELPETVAVFEPHLALYGGPDGLEPYRIITRGLETYLADDGHVIFEIGHRQGSDVCDILKRNNLQSIELIKDLAGLDRIVCARKAD